MPFGKPHPAVTDYYLFVCRTQDYPHADVWPFTVRDPIPTVPVPLLPAHGDIPLDLQEMVTEIYDGNRYTMRIDYAQAPAPPFGPVDAAWAADLLHKHVRKGKKKAT